MLLNDIKRNRHRVYSILIRLQNVLDDKDRIKDVLRQLAREDLLSEEQFEQIMEIEEFSLPAVADIVKGTKTGQGLKFLPRTIVGLTAKLPLLLQELQETGQSRVKNELAGVLEEPLRRGGISLKRYQHIKHENNIL